MNLKEFDAKQFLLEKGERVGLGIAVTLMVLMLVLSLFMPSSGFFSGSPSKNAEALETGTKKLESALASAVPTDADKPGATEGKLIKLETDLLKLDNYALEPWFAATRSESPSRRPPTIKNIDEAVAWAGSVPIDTYLFVGRDFSKIVILRDPDRKAPTGGNPRGGNPLAQYYKQSAGGMPLAPTAPGGNMGAQMQRQMGQFKNLTGQRVQGGEEKPEYETATIPVANIDSSTHLAHQLRPLHMALIAASFPYKAQLEEFKNKLRKNSVQEVLDETIKEGKEEQYAFRFLGVLVQRMELDAGGKKLTDWQDLDLNASYRLWMQHSGLPFEPDDPKLDPIKPISVGLMMPRLRQFREENPQNFLAAMGGMNPMNPMGPRGPRGGQEAPPPPRDGDSKYPDIEVKLKGIASTLEKLADVSPKQVAAPPSKFRTEGLDVFNPNPLPTEDQNTPREKTETPESGPVVPEYCLVRLADVTIEPGKFYRYRLKVRMANPNYGRSDVASVTYKTDKELLSEKWVELDQTITTSSDMVYYVVDQKHVSKDPKADKPARENPLYAIWNLEPTRDRQVVFQFHRWVESTPIVPDGEPVPVGEWSVADRVFVARGEYIGRPVKVDLPVWKYTQDAFVLPAEDQKKKVRGKVPTGVTVNFGQDNADNEMILVDFEGGRRIHEEPDPTGSKPIKVDETAAFEVLMLTADGRLLARNGAADNNDEVREKRRSAVRGRIEEVRAGKTAGAGPGGGSGLDKR